MTPPSDEEVEVVAKTFHELYFRRFWDGAQQIEQSGVVREFDPERESWEKFDSRHKEALRESFKEIIDQGLISIGTK